MPFLIEDLKPFRAEIEPQLRQSLQQPELGEKERLRLSLAMVAEDEGQVAYLYDRLVSAEPAELPVVRDALAPCKDSLLEKLWAVVESPDKSKQRQRLRAASALATYTPDDPRWKNVGGAVAAKLVAENSLVVGIWTEELRPARRFLLAGLADILEDEGTADARKINACDVYASFAAEDPRLFEELAKRLYGKKCGARAPSECRGSAPADEPVRQDAGNPRKRSPADGTKLSALSAPSAGNRSQAALEAVGAGEGSPDPQGFGSGPGRVRTGAVGACRSRGRDYAVAPLVSGRSGSRHPRRHRVVASSLETGCQDRDRRHGVGNRKKGRESAVVRNRPRAHDGSRSAPVEYAGGFPLGHVCIARGFAIAQKDVTAEQYRCFRKDHQNNFKDADCPVDRVSWYDAVAYCNWLSGKEGIPKDQWCYEFELQNGQWRYEFELNSAIPYTGGVKIHLGRHGYRLPSELEWEYACASR